MNDTEKRALFALWCGTTSLIAGVGVLVTATHLGWYTRELWIGLTTIWAFVAIALFGFALVVVRKLHVNGVTGA